MSFDALETTLVWNNTLIECMEALGLFLLLGLVLVAVKRLILWRFTSVAEHTENDIDDTIIHVIRSLRMVVLIVIAFYVAVRTLNVPDSVMQGINMVFAVLLVYQVIRTIQIVIQEFFFQHVLRQKLGEDEKNTMAVGVIRTTTRGVLWLIGILFLAQNFGLDITSLVAGLGIGGIAVALALQNILSDLFSSFSIIFDKPFEVGDFIVVDDKTMGVVKNVGMKTTRLEALHGEEIVLANKEITASRIHNLKRMQKRRIVFQLSLPYVTPNAQLKKVSGIVEEIITRIEAAQFDRANLTSLADEYLVFEVVFYALTRDYATYRKINEEILLAVKERFEKRELSLPIKHRRCAWSVFRNFFSYCFWATRTFSFFSSYHLVVLVSFWINIKKGVRALREPPFVCK